MIAEISIHVRSVHRLRQEIQKGWIFWHTPNGELHDAPRARAKLAAMGMLPGVPDLTVIDPQGKLHFMEFKREGGELDPAQQAFQRWAIRAGVPHSVVRSVNEAMQVFTYWGCIPQPPITGPEVPTPT